MATDRENLEVRVTTQGAKRAADELDAVAKKADQLDNKTIDIGGLAAGGGLAALGAGVALVANGMADAAIEADNLSALTGDSVEQASRLNAVWKQTGADTKDLQDVLLQMNGVLATNSDLAAELGVNLDDGATVGQRFEQVAAALDQVEDSAKRSHIASQVFGEEGVRQYNALRQSVGDLSAAMEDVPEGSVFDEDDVEEARRLKGEIKELTAELQGFANQVGGFVIPAVNDLIDGLKGVYRGFFESGQRLRIFLETGDFADWSAVEGLREAETAAAGFDRALLEGLTTIEQVRDVVERYTGNVEAANIVVVEWARQQDAAAAAVEHTGEAASQAADDVTTLAEATKTLADEIRSGASGAREMEQALRDAFGTKVQELIQGVIDRVAEVDQAVRDRLDLEGLIDDIAEQFGEVNEAAEEASKNGADGARRHREAVRDLRRMMLDLIGDLDHLSANDKIQLVTEVERSSVDQLFLLLGELTKGVTVPVSFSTPSQPGFDSANIAVGGGRTPSLSFSGVTAPTQSAIPSTIVYVQPPIGTTPTSITEQGRDYARIYGNRNLM